MTEQNKSHVGTTVGLVVGCLVVGGALIGSTLIRTRSKTLFDERIGEHDVTYSEGNRENRLTIQDGYNTYTLIDTKDRTPLVWNSTLALDKTDLLDRVVITTPKGNYTFNAGAKDRSIDYGLGTRAFEIANPTYDSARQMIKDRKQAAYTGDVTGALDSLRVFQSELEKLSTPEKVSE